MKKTFRITGIILITLLYWLTVSTFISSSRYSTIDNFPKAESEAYFSLITVNPFQHTAQSENSLLSLSKIPTRTLEETFYKFSLLKENTERLTVNSFTQYTSISLDFLILYRKFNIIFPFHNFW